MIYTTFECDACGHRTDIKRTVAYELPWKWAYRYLANKLMLFCDQCSRELDRQGYGH